jgi:hypothetical protein
MGSRSSLSLPREKEEAGISPDSLSKLVAIVRQEFPRDQMMFELHARDPKPIDKPKQIKLYKLCYRREANRIKRTNTLRMGRSIFSKVTSPEWQRQPVDSWGGGRLPKNCRIKGSPLPPAACGRDSSQIRNGAGRTFRTKRGLGLLTHASLDFHRPLDRAT